MQRWTDQWRPVQSYQQLLSFPSVRLLLVVAMVHNLAVTALDVKDDFLAVDQKQVIFVLTPMWIRELGQDRATRWLLEECSPGSIIVERTCLWTLCRSWHRALRWMLNYNENDSR